MEKPEEYISPVQAAELLGVSRSTVLRMLREGKLGGHQARRKWVVHRSAVEAIIAGQRQPERKPKS